jgi:DHA2 family multidrug resistance protein-like MFS transporter
MYATASPTPATTQPGLRWVVLAVLAGCVGVIAVDNTIVNVALPRLQEDLAASTSQLQWVVDAYSLMFAGALLTAGSLGDRFGRQRILLVGLGIFGFASAMAATAGDASTLTAWRALMGIGGACIMPSTLSLLTQVFPDPAERAKAIGIWAAVAGAAVGIGPIAGGLLLERFDWHAIFMVNPPVIVVLLGLVAWLVPDSRDPAKPRLDPVGAVLSTLGLVLVVYAVVEAPDGGLSAGVVVPAVAGAALLAAFIFWERASDHPMLPLEFFANRVFTGAVATVALVYFALMGAMFLVPQYLQLVLGNSPLGSGLGMIPLAAGLLLASLASSSVAARVGVRATVTAGMSAVAAGLAAASMVGATTPEWVLATGLGVVGVGLGLTLPQATNAIVGSVPRQKSGIASAVNDAVSELGGSFGVAVLGAVLTTRYRGSIDQAVSDAGSAVDTLPGGVLEAVRESLGSASLAAPRAGADAANVITQTAGAAFTTGMGMALTAAAVVVAVGAVMAWRVFPHQLPASGHG